MITDNYIGTWWSWSPHGSDSEFQCVKITDGFITWGNRSGEIIGGQYPFKGFLETSEIHDCRQVGKKGIILKPLIKKHRMVSWG